MVSVVVQVDKHELRHTQATLLLANGVDVKTVQTRLGHASASITLGWYAHAIPEKDHEVADLLGSLLAAKPEEGDGSDALTSENAVDASSKGVETEDEQDLNLRPQGYEGVSPVSRAQYPAGWGVWARGACRLSRARCPERRNCSCTGRLPFVPRAVLCEAELFEHGANGKRPCSSPQTASAHVKSVLPLCPARSSLRSRAV